MAFLPNRDKFYNTETKRLHAANLDVWGGLDTPSKELGDFTFNLVTKIDPWYKFWLIRGGTDFYPAEVFPTEDTTARILKIARDKFPGLVWTVTGNQVNPASIKEQVNLQATNKEGVTESFSPGLLAVNIMVNGEPYAINTSFALEVRQAFED